MLAKAASPLKSEAPKVLAARDAAAVESQELKGEEGNTQQTVQEEATGEVAVNNAAPSGGNMTAERNELNASGMTVESQPLG